MLIKTISGNSWILPKGNPEDDLSQAQVAELECFEEAGVKGKVYDSGFQKEFKREAGGSITIYPLLIKKILDEWPEQSIRKRRLVTIEEALSLVTKKEYFNAIDHFSSSPIIKKLSKE